MGRGGWLEEVRGLEVAIRFKETRVQCGMAILRAGRQTKGRQRGTGWSSTEHDLVLR
jgi:hypothetical protein